MEYASNLDTTEFNVAPVATTISRQMLLFAWLVDSEDTSCAKIWFGFMDCKVFHVLIVDHKAIRDTTADDLAFINVYKIRNWPIKKSKERRQIQCKWDSKNKGCKRERQSLTFSKIHTIYSAEQLEQQRQQRGRQRGRDSKSEKRGKFRSMPPQRRNGGERGGSDSRGRKSRGGGSDNYRRYSGGKKSGGGGNRSRGYR